MVEDDGSMRRAVSCRTFADEHQLVMISIEDLREYRFKSEKLVRRVVETRMPTRHGDLTALGYTDQQDVEGHLALVTGLDANGRFADGDEVLVRLHSECLTGEALGSMRCDCGPQLDASVERIAAAGRGVLIYMRGHEGRGIGLMAKLEAYALQDRGFDTVDANTELGLPVDAREYRTAADILLDLGVRSIRLLTNNPAKVEAMNRYGIEVSARLPLVVGAHPENVQYLRTKRDRMGHHLMESVSGRPPGGPSATMHPSGTSPGPPVPTWSWPRDDVARVR
jgi:3,4-dihydroxy 2-butanone 4-phosphate synthase/GTP cyclohydrolase II